MDTGTKADVFCLVTVGLIAMFYPQQLKRNQEKIWLENWRGNKNGEPIVKNWWLYGNEVNNQAEL